MYKGDEEIPDSPPTRFGRQLIVQFTNTNDYSPVQNAGTALQNKAIRKGLTSEVIEIDPSADRISGLLMSKFQLLDNTSRLYLIGHSNGFSLQTLNPSFLASKCRMSWGLTAVKRITLVSCRAGHSNAEIDTSFAQTFHAGLSKVKIQTEVAAYGRPISVTPAGFAQKYQRPELEGKKVYYDESDKLHWMAEDSAVKKIWLWDENRKQVCLDRTQDRARDIR